MFLNEAPRWLRPIRYLLILIHIYPFSQAPTPGEAEKKGPTQLCPNYTYNSRLSVVRRNGQLIGEVLLYFKSLRYGPHDLIFALFQVASELLTGYLINCSLLVHSPNVSEGLLLGRRKFHSDCKHIYECFVMETLISIITQNDPLIVMMYNTTSDRSTFLQNLPECLKL